MIPKKGLVVKSALLAAGAGALVLCWTLDSRHSIYYVHSPFCYRMVGGMESTKKHVFSMTGT